MRGVMGQLSGTAMGYRLDDRGFESQQGLGISQLRVQTGSVAHPASYPMDAESKAAGA
jgi:hypothetical protein